MAILKKKSAFEKDRKQDKKEARKGARAVKKDARQDARAEKKDVRKETRSDNKDTRQDARATKKESRQDARGEKKDARQEKRAGLKSVRQSDLKGQEKRDAKKAVRSEKRTSVKAATGQKKDEVKKANQVKKDTVRAAKDDRKDTRQSANAEKRDLVKAANEKKRAALKALRIPRAANRKWNSYLRFQIVKAEEIFQPKTLAHLQAICRIATENDMEVRAIGSGHSFSEIGQTEGIFVQTHKMDKILTLGPAKRRDRLKPEYLDARHNKFAEVEVGCTIIELSKALEKKNQALINQGTYDGQTLWGAVSTSTHGSGIKRQAFPEMVLSVVMVGEGGRTYRIEPTDGITKPRGWKEPGIDELIQDDNTFYSVICSMGCMGIVYSAIIKVRDFYWLDEWTYITTWDTYKSAFADAAEHREMLHKWDTFSMLVSPTKSQKGKKDGVSFKDEYPCSLTFRKETSQRRVIGGRFFDALAKTFEDLHIITGNAPATGRWYLPKLTNIKRDDAWLARSAAKQSGKHGWTGGELDPESLPIKRRNKCYKIFPKGGKLFGGYGIELSFPMERTFDVMDRIIRLAEANDDNKLFHTAPVAIRYVAKGKAYASPQYNRETVMFEVLMAKGTKGGPEALALVEEAMLGEPDVRVHWGLNMDRMTSDNTDLSAMYPRWGSWMTVFRRFNQRGTFHNTFTRRLGLSR